jgi:hypothetical protein
LGRFRLLKPDSPLQQAILLLQGLILVLRS